MLQSSSPTLCLRQLNVYVDTFLSTMTCVGAPLAERVEKKEKTDWKVNNLAGYKKEAVRGND